MKIVFNGTEYASLEQMPEAARAEYLTLVALLGDANRNGIPDVAEQTAGGTPRVMVSQKIVVNGQEYSDLSQLPPAVRAILERTNALAVSSGASVELGGSATDRRPAFRINFSLPGQWLVSVLAAITFTALVLFALWRIGVLKLG
jgi:hypothetical protein